MYIHTFGYVCVFLDFNIFISYILHVFLLNSVKVDIFFSSSLIIFCWKIYTNI